MPSAPSPTLILAVHPEGEAAALTEHGEGVLQVRVTTPGGPWHWSADSGAWRAALDALDAGLAQVAAHPGLPLHVCMRGPYALGLRVGQGVQTGRALHVHQLSPERAHPGTWRWQDWGPAGLDPAQIRRARFFAAPRGLADLRPRDTDVVLVIQVSRDILSDPAHEFARQLGLDRRTPVVVLSVDAPGQSAMGVGDLGPAAAEIEETIEAIHRRSTEGPTLHLVLVAPLALAIAAGRKIHIRGQVLAYERLTIQGAHRYVPVLRFPDGRPAWPGSSVDDALVEFLLARLSTSELRRLFAGVASELVHALPGDNAAPSAWRYMEMGVHGLRTHPAHQAAFFEALRAERPVYAEEVDALRARF